MTNSAPDRTELPPMGPPLLDSLRVRLVRTAAFVVALIAFMILTGGLAATIVMAITGSSLHAVTATSRTVGLATYLLAELMLCAVVVGAGIRVFGRERLGLTTTGMRSGVRWSAPIVMLFVALPLVFGGLPHDAGSILRDSAVHVVVAVLFVAAIGIAEEVTFRGIIFETLGGARAPIAAVCVSSLVFGVAHVAPFVDVPLQNWLNAVKALLAIGIPFAIMRLRGASLFALAGVHAIVDLYAILAIGDVQLPPASVGSEVGGLIASLALATGYVTWHMCRPQRS